MEDVRSGRVDVIVVYKVDRLTRSLADFAKIVDVLDAAGASFVSVTQAFNTTTSMGRLTLNVLLSFAQFEREVTAERIRDKLAASKAKGMWMGGSLPLGYDVCERRLIVNPEEAHIVRFAFQTYLEEPSVHDVLAKLEAKEFRSKRWISKAGKAHGGMKFSRGTIYYLLRNRLYLGEISHRGKIHPGQHDAIVDRDTFARVQEKLLAGTQVERTRVGTSNGHALLGRLFDDRGNAMTGTHANKGGRRYFYYVSTAANVGNHARAGSLSRVSAPVIEAAVWDLALPLIDPDWRLDLEAPKRLLSAISKVTVGANAISIEFKADAVDRKAAPSLAPAESFSDLVATREIELVRRSSAHILSIDGKASAQPRRVDRTLVRSIVMAKRWVAMLDSGEVPSIDALARQEHLCPRNTARVLPLAYLAPDLVEMILAGRQPVTFTLSKLLDAQLPYAWSEQRALFAEFV
jgi:site-specific DNA recombinase